MERRKEARGRERETERRRGREERREQEAGRLFLEINNGNFPAHEAAVLLGALNSSGQYALSSGIINADLVACGASRWRAGVQLGAVTNGQPAVVSAQRSRGRRPPGDTGAERALSWCE